jgi:hypothetical protein
MELGKCIHSSRVRTADSWLGSYSLVIFKFSFIGFLESCSPLLPDYESSSKKKVKNLQKKATCPSFCYFLKKIHKLSTTPTSQQQPTLPFDQSHHRICGTRQETREDGRVLFTFLLLADQPIQNSSQSSWEISGVTKNSGSNWGRQNSPEKPRKKFHTRSKPAPSCKEMKGGSKQFAQLF